ncbi:MAG TPA: phospholipase D family protein [Candidatus Pelethocola excrementipullorum]|nr:phospholipase D family protein [Candidatus Pelethocola excrementipullorum]
MKMKRKIGLAFIVVVVFIIAAIVGPFMHYKKVSKSTKESFNVEEFYGDQEGSDRAQLLETNISAWDERIRLFEQAQDRIIMSTFDIRPGESAKDVLAMLLHKAEAGVKVQVLVDGVSGLIRMEGEELFYAVSSHPNVEIKIYNMLNPLQLWKSQGRMHDKYIIVDDLAYILGGRNTFDYFIGDYATNDRSRDREVLVYNTKRGDVEDHTSSLWQVEAYFKKIWDLDVCTYFHNDESLREKEGVQKQILLLEERYEKLRNENPELFETPDYVGRTVPTNQIQLVSNPTGIYGKEPVVFYELSELMKQARSQVTIHTPYAVCNGYMYDTLKEICDQVPEVHMLVNSVENGDNVVASSDYLKFKGKLLDTGIQILEYDGGESYHGKSILIDDNLSVIGSYNLDLRSTYVDTELMLVIDSRPFNAELKEAMDSLEKDCRTVIDVDTYETPDHIQVAEVPFMKKVLWAFLGIVLHPFRVMI